MLVSINNDYSYNIMMSNILLLKKKYPFLKFGNIGYSVLGNPIPYIRIGFGKNEVFYSGSFHANEWITSIILMKFIEDFSEAYSNNLDIYGYNSYEIFNKCSIYIVPMLNPDGVNLVTGIYNSNSFPYLNAKNISENYSNIPFSSGWKSNINGENFINFHLFVFKK